jgi:segregation and condensation protein B
MPEDSKILDSAEIKAVLEALIYVSEDPVREEELLRLFPAGTEEAVRLALAELVLEYEGVPRGLRISRVAGGYRMQTRPEHDDWIRGLFRIRNRVRLSRAALETLSIIAYRQPVTTPEIQSIRGTNPLGVLQTLLERRLIKTLGRKRVVGKPILYGTTEDFLVYFGLNSLADLPSLEDFVDPALPPEPAGEETPRVMEGILSAGPEVRASSPALEEPVALETRRPEAAGGDASRDPGPVFRHADEEE